MIWYTPCSGIWQSVFLESVPTEHVVKLDLAADMNGKGEFGWLIIDSDLLFPVNVTVHSSNTNTSTPYEIIIHEQNSEDVKDKATGTTGVPFVFKVSSPKLWTPNHPNLYNITIKLGKDTIKSYTGFRTVSRGIVNGVQRPLLNGEFIFPFGTLDQGYWYVVFRHYLWDQAN